MARVRDSKHGGFSQKDLDLQDVEEDQQKDLGAAQQMFTTKTLAEFAGMIQDCNS
ncbi:hypothetical protein COLO4_37659 [Corchorus olitorius]|uniref:Uncharacterized protein n=1 Tax=Corchorus olitorius TaxID=93759 RepID=A0A1R3G028_9ROSI|nr:hypothetical protein COLO4_37659 [Corchorus olitorius]